MGDEKLDSSICEWGTSQVRQDAPKPRQRLIYKVLSVHKNLTTNICLRP